MKIKKFLPLIVVLLVILAAIPLMVVAASAEEATATEELVPSEGLEFERNYKYNYYSVKGIGTFEGTELVIPSTYKGLPVRRILNKAFLGQTQLTKVVIPDSVDALGASIFQDCTSLKEVTLSNSMTYISPWMFANCDNLGHIVIPESVTNIQPSAFRNSTFESVTFPSKVTRIAANSFRNTKGFVDLVIPDSVTELGGAAFARINTLKTAVVGSGVTALEAEVFYDCRSMRTVTLPEGLTSIGNSSFEQCVLLRTINLPSTLTRINARAFYDVRYITTLDLPEGLTYVGGNAFRKMTRLETIIFPAGIANIGNNNGADCPAFVNAFYKGSEADFGAVTTGSITTMKKIMRYYTEEQPMENAEKYWHYVDGVPTIWEAYVAPEEQPSDYTLSEDGKYYIVTGSTIELAGATDLVLPATFKDLPVKAIAANAFAGNTALKTLVIGANVTVENGAFDGSAVTEIYFEGAVADWNCLTTATVYFYSETQPEVEGNYWSYVNGEIVLWGPASGDDDAIELPPVGV